MNFKFIFCLFFLTLFFSGCGVKARPTQPPETAIQSYINQFIYDEEPKNQAPPAPPSAPPKSPTDVEKEP